MKSVLPEALYEIPEMIMRPLETVESQIESLPDEAEEELEESKLFGEVEKTEEVEEDIVRPLETVESQMESLPDESEEELEESKLFGEVEKTEEVEEDIVRPLKTVERKSDEYKVVEKTPTTEDKELDELMEEIDDSVFETKSVQPA
jgi:hypothetical protein